MVAKNMDRMLSFFSAIIKLIMSLLFHELLKNVISSSNSFAVSTFMDFSVVF